MTDGLNLQKASGTVFSSAAQMVGCQQNSPITYVLILTRQSKFNNSAVRARELMGDSGRTQNTNSMAGGCIYRRGAIRPAHWVLGWFTGILVKPAPMCGGLLVSGCREVGREVLANRPTHRSEQLILNDTSGRLENGQYPIPKSLARIGSRPIAGQTKRLTPATVGIS